MKDYLIGTVCYSIRNRAFVRRPAAGLPQRMRPAQLTEKHGYKLPPTGKSPRVSLSLRLLHQTMKLHPREQL